MVEERVVQGLTNLRHYNPLKVKVFRRVCVLMDELQNGGKVLWRWMSGDGCRQRILLEASSLESARRRFGSDGRL